MPQYCVALAARSALCRTGLGYGNIITNHFILGGTDDECDSGICWADTLCDTNKGDGILFDKDNPQHQRFCGELVLILLGFQ